MTDEVQETPEEQAILGYDMATLVAGADPSAPGLLTGLADLLIRRASGYQSLSAVRRTYELLSVELRLAAAAVPAEPVPAE